MALYLCQKKRKPVTGFGRVTLNEKFIILMGTTTSGFYDITLQEPIQGDVIVQSYYSGDKTVMLMTQFFAEVTNGSSKLTSVNITNMELTESNTKVRIYYVIGVDNFVGDSVVKLTTSIKVPYTKTN